MHITSHFQCRAFFFTQKESPFLLSLISIESICDDSMGQQTHPFHGAAKYRLPQIPVKTERKSCQMPQDTDILTFTAVFHTGAHTHAHTPHCIIRAACIIHASSHARRPPRSSSQLHAGRTRSTHFMKPVSCASRASVMLTFYAFYSH